MLLQLRRWLPERPLVLVVDSGYAALEFLGGLANRRRAITCITRLRLDAQLYAPAPPRYPGQIGRPGRKGKRLPSWRQRITDRRTRWQSITVPHCYGAGPRPPSGGDGHRRLVSSQFAGRASPLGADP